MKELGILNKELKKQHGGELDLKNHKYYLFYQDGLFQLSVEDGELKVEVVYLGESARVYFTDKKLTDELSVFQEDEKPTDGNQ